MKKLPRLFLSLARFTLGPVLIVSLGALLASCTAMREVPTDEVLVADSLQLRLPAPGELNMQVNAMQLLSGRYGEQTFDLQLMLEWRNDAIVVAALSHFGNTLFSMTYDGQKITTVGNGLVIRGLDTAYVLADMLLTFADKSLLESNLKGQGLTIEDRPLGRIISRGGRAIIEIEYQDPSKWGGPVKFRHIERGYEYDIETVQYDLS